jgi:hypothetical protein
MNVKASKVYKIAKNAFGFLLHLFYCMDVTFGFSCSGTDTDSEYLITGCRGEYLNLTETVTGGWRNLQEELHNS